jgi:hypothetical protein
MAYRCEENTNRIGKFLQTNMKSYAAIMNESLPANERNANPVNFGTRFNITIREITLAIAITLTPAHDQSADSRNAEHTPSGTPGGGVKLDVNRDGMVSPVDVLESIRRLNGHPLPDTHSGGEERFDVNGDGRHTTEDISAVIEAINAGVGAQTTNEQIIPRQDAKPSSESPATRHP